MANHTVAPIGVYHSLIKNPAEAGRQPSQDHHLPAGEIKLFPGQNFEQALIGLEGVERLWIIFLFHKNNQWKPMVRPPRGRQNKIGVFATRAPYRPNFIGMSCVRLSKISKLSLEIADADLLDQTPILDIKPYLPYADSFPNAKVDWLDNIEQEKYYVTFSEQVNIQLLWLQQSGVNGIQSFLLNQLEYEPTNDQKKRVRELSDDQYEIAYRTWRCLFCINENQILVKKIYSGYSTHELTATDDPYRDKVIHFDYIKRFQGQK